MATLTETKPPKTKSPKRNGKKHLSGRLNCRINPAIKQRAEEAAQLLGQSITAFTEAALDEKAQTILEREERIVLSERDFARVVESINNPKPPGAALKKAAEKFKAISQQHPEANW